MKVLIIPEDQALDQYVVKPVIKALFSELGMTARVDILPEPRLRGAAEALDADVVASIIDKNPMEDLFLLIVDADCEREHNTDKARARVAEHADKLIACVAVQEVEVWMLALYKDQLGVSFTEVRAECDPKERFADPLLDKLGRDSAGRGRKGAMLALKGRWPSLRDTCPELKALRDAIAAWHVQTS